MASSSSLVTSKNSCSTLSAMAAGSLPSRLQSVRYVRPLIATHVKYVARMSSGPKSRTTASAFANSGGSLVAAAPSVTSPVKRSILARTACDSRQRNAAIAPSTDHTDPPRVEAGTARCMNSHAVDKATSSTAESRFTASTRTVMERRLASVSRNRSAATRGSGRETRRVTACRKTASRRRASASSGESLLRAENLSGLGHRKHAMPHTETSWSCRRNSAATACAALSVDVNRSSAMS
mmetsp:Transcript_19961/g.61990  ORF Transcript_19961/g.61990 Transcript_19961/m.61990 type:complete len:238 (-) Transcript_19961:392-1105(-)